MLVSTSFVGVSYTADNSSTISFDSNTLYVGGSGEGNYTKIQDAIDDASDGDTVFVYDDSSPYYESIYVNKSINLIGENRYRTRIEGGCHISVDEVKVNNFTFKNGFGVKIESNYNKIIGNNILYRCIRLYSSSNNIIHNNIISMNVEWAGIYLIESCKNNTLSDNDISRSGEAGISLEYNCSNNTISGNNIKYNEGGWWSFGILIIDSNNNSITNNIISKHDDEGMYIDGSYNCNISGNIVFDNNKGIFLDSSSGCSINQNIVLNNTLAGIELWYDSNHNSITRNTISKNKYGISSYVNNITITGNNISNNKRGISVVGNKITITDNSIQNNKLGLLIGSWKGIVRKNNFIGNRRHTMFRVPNLLRRNTWDSNYWDNWIGLKIPMFQEFPKVIFGNLGLLGFIPWIYFDWHPSKEPYEL